MCGPTDDVAEFTGESRIFVSDNCYVYENIDLGTRTYLKTCHTQRASDDDKTVGLGISAAVRRRTAIFIDRGEGIYLFFSPSFMCRRRSLLRRCPFCIRFLLTEAFLTPRAAWPISDLGLERKKVSGRPGLILLCTTCPDKKKKKLSHYYGCKSKTNAPT